MRRTAWPLLRRKIANMGVRGRGWTRARVAGGYGHDWLLRTATNMTDIWANALSEIVSFSLGSETTLDGGSTSTMTFRADDLPSSHVKYFWSLTVVDAVHFRAVPNPLNRFALNQRSPLEYGQDGSLTLYMAPECPPGAPPSNWLPTPRRQNYILTWRAYGPDNGILEGTWFPPAVVRARAYDDLRDQLGEASA